jgi:hypothetical protein
MDVSNVSYYIQEKIMKIKVAHQKNKNTEEWFSATVEAALCDFFGTGRN